MTRSKSSHRWLQEHHTDKYVLQSRKDGYRSRASYKLLALNQADGFLKPGMSVIDLGAAPGGWTQVVREHVGDSGQIIATDILPMECLPGVHFVQGDFTEQGVLDEILTIVHRQPVDLVISDMAPNMSGIKTADDAAAMYLTELALDLASQILRIEGSFVTKIFHGEGFDAILASARKAFKKVTVRKPDASRARSREVYIVATGFGLT